MKFDQPERLVLLVVPAVLAVLMFARRRRVRDAVQFADVGLLEELRSAAPAPWRRRMVAAGMLCSLVLWTLAAADPMRMAEAETTKQTVVLALDVSMSMEATDVSPNRLDAARTAAQSFLDSAPSTVSIGLVSFSSTVRVVVPPTRDRETTAIAIDALRTGPGTAVGEAVFTSIGLLETRGWEDDEETGDPIQLRTGAIVVLSDGATTVGRPDADAAAAAARVGVPVFSIAFGTPSGVIDTPEGTVSVPAAPDIMALYADETGATTYEAFTTAELADVFTELAESISVESAWTSFADLVALAGLAVATIAAALWARSVSRL